MPRVITAQESLESFLTGLIDKDGSEVIAERIVDITDICEETASRERQAIIKYAWAQRGLVAQLEEVNTYGSSSSHFHPEELGTAGLIVRDNFLYWSRFLGCNVMQLAETIADFTPEPSPIA